MAGRVGNTSLGLGSPQPLSYGYRMPAIGKPPVKYEPRSGEIQATVGQGQKGASLEASFQPRPPMRPVGTYGIGEHVDVTA